MIGDLWRWGMPNPDARRDLEKAWRQMVRWLVSDVPRQVELTLEPGTDPGAGTVNLQVRVRDAKFQPVEDAAVSMEILPMRSTPTNAIPTPLRLRAEPSLKEPGVYELTYVPHDTGGYLARACVTNSAGIELGRAEAGWSTDLAADESFVLGRWVATNKKNASASPPALANGFGTAEEC